MNALYGIIAATGLLMLVALIRSFYRVEEGHAALVESFGQIRRDASGKALIIGPGLHGKKPWENAHEFSVMERILTIREEGREVELLAHDGTLLRMDPQVRFRFRPEQAETFVFGMEKPIRHLRELFRSLLANEIARFGTKDSEEGSYAEIRRNRRELNDALQRDGEEGFSNKYGIDFRSADIAEILPPAELAEALNSVQKVEAEYETLVKRIEAECEQQVVAAEHGVQIARTRAEAAEMEIDVLGGAVTDLKNEGTLDAYLRRRKDEVASLSKTIYLRSE